MFGDSWKNKPVSYLVSWWWALLVLMGLLDRVYRGDSQLAELAFAAETFLQAVDAILAIALVREINRQQEEKYQKLMADSPQPIIPGTTL